MFKAFLTYHFLMNVARCLCTSKTTYTNQKTRRRCVVALDSAVRLTENVQSLRPSFRTLATAEKKSVAPFFQVVANLTGFYLRSMKKVRPQPLQIVFSLPEKLVCDSFVGHRQVIVAYECARASHKTRSQAASGGEKTSHVYTSTPCFHGCGAHASTTLHLV